MRITTHSLKKQRDTEHLSAQLTSLQLILDRNRKALQLRIDDEMERSRAIAS